MQKVCYPGKKMAQTVLNQAMRHRGRHGRAEQLRAYDCKPLRDVAFDEAGQAMSKMQDILDEAEKNWKAGKANDAFAQLVEAIKLLSRGQQQVMDSFEKAQSSRTDMQIK